MSAPSIRTSKDRRRTVFNRSEQRGREMDLQQTVGGEIGPAAAPMAVWDEGQEPAWAT